MKKTKKIGIKILKSIGFTIFTFILLLILLPVLFKSDLLNAVKSELNRNLNAEVSFSDASLSFIRNFPNVSLKIENLKITGQDTFVNKSLFDSRTILLGFDLLSIINKKRTPKLTLLRIDDPQLLMLILENGASNFDIFKEQEPTVQDTAAGEIALLLDNVKITDGHLVYRDLQSSSNYELKSLQGSLQGAIKSRRLNSRLELIADEVLVSVGNIPYLNNFRSKVTGGLSYDFETSGLEFIDIECLINEFAAKVEGELNINQEDVDMDIKFFTPNQALKPFISILPGAYVSNFADVSVSGEFNLNGSIKGKYSNLGEYPLYDITTQIKNGEIKYPDLPESISELFTQINIKALDKHLKNQSIIVDTLHSKIGESLIEGRLNILYREVNPRYSGNLFANLDLKKLQNAWPLETVEKMSGLMDAELSFEFDQNQVEEKAYDQIRFTGEAEASQLNIKLQGYPEFSINLAVAKSTPQDLIFKVDNLNTTNSALSTDIKVIDPLAYFGKERIPNTNINFTATTLDLNEWIAEPDVKGDIDTLNRTTSIPPMQIAFTGSIDELRYEDYIIKNLITSLNYKDDQLTIHNLQGVWDQSQLKLNGDLRSISEWINGTNPLTGTLNMHADYFDLNPWMQIDTLDTTEGVNASTSDKILPSDVAIAIQAKLDHLVYHNMDFRNMQGKATLVSHELEINSLTSQSFGGNLALSGLYSETEPMRSFNLKADLNQISFKDIFERSKTFALIAPIAEYLQGKFNSTIVFDGKMGPQGDLVWNFFNAAGFVETIAAELSEYQPIEKLANKLNLEKLKSIPWQNTKNWFEVKAGSVFIKPFTFSYQGIPMTISGQHRIDMNIDYDLLLRVPRKLLNKTGIGDEVDRGINWVETQLKKVNIQQEIGDTVYVIAKLTGQFKNPESTFKVVNRSHDKSLEQDVKDQLSEIIESKKDTLTQKVKDTLQKIQDSLTKVAQKEIDKKVSEAEKKAKEVVDTIKQKAVDKSKEVLDSITRDKLGKVIDSTLTGKVDTVLGKEVENIKDVLKKWDPFKKKKRDTTKIINKNKGKNN